MPQRIEACSSVAFGAAVAISPARVILLQTMQKATRSTSARRVRKRAVPESKLHPARSARLVLIVATAVCFAPFVGKAFNIDDPLFIWVAQQVVHHPLNPYGFSVVWYSSSMPMSEVMKNPPLASYYAALVGPWTNWSEFALHLAFWIPAAAVILATYELARSLTGNPVLAALFTLSAPAFLTSGTTVMCDVAMLALWMLAVLAWHRGLSRGRG